MKKLLTPFILCISIMVRADSWMSMAVFPGQGRELPCAFAIGNNGYVACGNGTLIFGNMMQ